MSTELLKYTSAVAITDIGVTLMLLCAKYFVVTEVEWYRHANIK